MARKPDIGQDLRKLQRHLECFFREMEAVRMQLSMREGKKDEAEAKRGKFKLLRLGETKGE